MIRFKREALEKRLEERRSHFTPHTYLHHQKLIDQGAEGIDPITLFHLCGDLDCLPTDIVEFI